MKILKNIIIFLGVILVIFCMIVGFIVYEIGYSIRTIDVSQSKDGRYKLYFQTIGESLFFSDQKSRLFLKDGWKRILVKKFNVSNDGKVLDKYNWNVKWNKDNVEAVVNGEEQSDIKYILYFEGKKTSTINLGNSRRLRELERMNNNLSNDFSNKFKTGQNESSNVSTTDTDKSSLSSTLDSEEDSDAKNFNKSVENGFEDIYKSKFKSKGFVFKERYDAKGNQQIVLRENNKEICLLVFDRMSDNDKCRVYVYEKVDKNSDGSWSISDASILDIYAVTKSGKVISSGMKSYSEVGSKEFIDVTTK